MPDKKSFDQEALDYHEFPTPGKIAIKATTQLTTQRDLALAYSPGVAAPCLEIEKDPMASYKYTSRGNMIAVISNGTAVLGLGDIGALASKPVMEGKSVLFKKFAAIDSIDIEIDETDVDAFCKTVKSMEPSFGGINLEDIKAPECFEIETRLKAEMNIPVFHDDQHGTAIIVGAAFKNWITLTGRKMSDIRLVANGAGASAISCLNILVALGLPKDNITVCDRNGVIYKGRTEGMDPYKEKFAVDTNARSLDDAIEGANVFLGLSAAGALSQDNCRKMADKPLVMALANPTPEIMPELVKEAHPDAIVCTGRSDYTNQVNNVLCFPFLFRGALDCGATQINEEMKLACVEAIAELAQAEASHEVAAVYADEALEFGPDYLIPKPFDPRLIVKLPIAVAKAAMDSGIAQRPIKDFAAYERKLQQYFYRSNLIMGSIFDKAKTDPKKVVFAEGEEERTLMAVQTILDEGIALPILIGRRRVIEARIKKLNLRLSIGDNIELCDPEDDPRYKDYWTQYHDIMQRKGVTPEVAKTVIRTNTTAIAALMVERGEAHALICGIIGQYDFHMKYLTDIIGLKDGVETPAALVGLIMSKGNLFITDTHVNPNPSVQQLTETTLLAAAELEKFGIEPNIAMLSHSNFGTSHLSSATKMREAMHVIKTRRDDLDIDGEMHADCALSESVRKTIMPNSPMKGVANLLVMPNVEAANITYNTVKIMNEATVVGPILLGMAKPVHIVTSAASPRTLVNLAAISSVSE
jgi:malate dehydrogenase (oxaloacetate-decarboxylating)(NADP+)